MSEGTEEKRGMGMAGYVGGAAAGVGAYKVADSWVARSGVSKALAGDKTTKGFETLVDTALEKNPSLDRVAKGIDALEGGAKGVSQVKFTKKGNMLFVKDGVGEVVKGVKPPEGFKAGELVKDPAKINGLFEGEKAFAKTAVQQGDKALTKGIAKTGGFFGGMRGAGLAGRAGIVGATVAGTVAGAMVLNRVFGGKHTDRAMEQNQQATLAR